MWSPLLRSQSHSYHVITSLIIIRYKQSYKNSQGASSARKLSTIYPYSPFSLALSQASSNRPAPTLSEARFDRGRKIANLLVSELDPRLYTVRRSPPLINLVSLERLFRIFRNAIRLRRHSMSPQLILPERQCRLPQWMNVGWINRTCPGRSISLTIEGDLC